MVKTLPLTMQEGSFLSWKRSPGRNDITQYSCLGNPCIYIAWTEESFGWTGGHHLVLWVSKWIQLTKQQQKNKL